MRIAVSEHDIARLKKSAKVLRQHLPGKIGQQKALDMVSSFLGYKDYFNLTREVVSSTESIALQDFKTHLAPTLNALGLNESVIDSLFSILAKLSAFNAPSLPKAIFHDEMGYHIDAQRRSSNADVIDFLSSNNLPRYEWWVQKNSTHIGNIHEPSVVVLNKVIQQIRELEQELGWEVPRFKSENFDVLAETVRSRVLPTSMVSAFEAVSDSGIAAKPFTFDIACGILDEGGSQRTAWAINHARTESLLEPVFTTQEAAQMALAGILVAGRLAKVKYDPGLRGTAEFSILKVKRHSGPVERREILVKAHVMNGQIVGAVMRDGQPGSPTVHRISAHGFDLIQYRDLNKVRLPAGIFTRWGTTELTAGNSDKGFDYAAASLPKSSEDVFGAISDASLATLRKLLSDFKILARTAESKVQSPLPAGIIEWMHSRLVSPTHKVDPEQYYEFDQQEMAKHVPQLAGRFPADLLDEWHQSYVADVRGYRPYGEVDGDPTEFICYLFYFALTGKEPATSNDVKVGAILLSLALQELSGQIDIDLLNEHRRDVETALNVMDTWRIELDSFRSGLRYLEPDVDMVSHGAEQTTMSDLFRMGRKFSPGTGLTTASQTMP